MSEGSAPVERNLQGRCGTCGFYIRLRTDAEGKSEGECRLGCWPAPLRDTQTCSSYKQVGASWEGALKRKKVAGAPRGYASEQREPQRKAYIPKEIGIDMDQDEFRSVLRQVIREEMGLIDSPMGDRWNGGELVLKPGKDGTQEKSLPLDTFFKKIVMVRDKLRVLEQKVNGNKSLSDADKMQMQQYITACYGSLTTFNVLFKEREDGFVGQRTK